MAINDTRRAKNKAYRELWYSKGPDNHLVLNRIEVPAQVAADRIRRLDTNPQSLTASMMGDPLPGYSALDR